MKRSRRSLLATTASGLTLSAAGCSDLLDSGSHPESDWDVQPESEGTPVEPLDCGVDGFARQYRWVEGDVTWGTLTEAEETIFTHRVDGSSFALGETVHVRFRNVSNETRGTGNPHKYNLDILTTDGWMDVRGWPDGVEEPITDELVELEPDQFHEWKFPLTETGVIEASFHSHQEEIAVCPDLQPGRYRFGLTETGLGDVAVAFDVTAAEES